MNQERVTTIAIATSVTFALAIMKFTISPTLSWVFVFSPFWLGAILFTLLWLWYRFIFIR